MDSTAVSGAAGSGSIPDGCIKFISLLNAIFDHLLFPFSFCINFRMPFQVT